MSSASSARALGDSWYAAAAAKGPNSSLVLAPKVIKAQENVVPKKSNLGIFLLHRSRPFPPLPI